MDACVLEPTPVATSNPPPAHLSRARWVSFALVAAISVGVLWRLVRYGLNFPIWGDEAMLLLNVSDRSYLELTHHLRFAQVAPLFFLWLEKTAILVLGSSEWSVHLFPFLASMGALGLFWHVCRSHFSPTVAGLAVAILAVSYYPVRHGAEVKPYSFDLLFAVMYAWLTLGYLRDTQSWRWLAALVVVAPIAIFTSYPSAFVGGAVSLVLLPRMLQASNVQRLWWAAFNVCLCGAFIVHYALVGRDGADPEAAQRSRDFLMSYWKDAFPPDTMAGWPLWLVKVLTGNMMAYPIGGHSGGSTVTTLFVVLGAVAIWRLGAYSPSPQPSPTEGRVSKGARYLLALCVLPFALNLVAAIASKYPFGGSARISLHLAPFICILMAHGIEMALGWCHTDSWRDRCHAIILLVFFACGAAGVVRDLVQPYKTIHDRDMRQMMLDMRAKVLDDEPVLFGHSSVEHVQAEFTWYLRRQSWLLDYVGDHPLDDKTRAAWVVICGTSEPSLDFAMSHLGSRRQEWTAEQSEVRFIPPENKVMSDLHVRWVRIVRVSR